LGLDDRKLNASSKCIKWRAKRTNDFSCLGSGLAKLVYNRQRIVSLYRLAEIAGRGKMVVHPAINYGEYIAA